MVVRAEVVIEELLDFFAGVVLDTFAMGGLNHSILR